MQMPHTINPKTLVISINFFILYLSQKKVIMSVRLVLNNFNKGFLIFGVGSTNYNHGNHKTSVVFYVWRCLLIYFSLHNFYETNLWVITIFKFILIVSYADTKMVGTLKNIHNFKFKFVNSICIYEHSNDTPVILYDNLLTIMIILL